jgi:hypothetical protein
VALRTYHIALQVSGRCRLPAFYGSELRGLLGQGLKARSCVQPTGVSSDCATCPPAWKRPCPYQRLFEAPAPPAWPVPEGREAPRPFVLHLSDVSWGGGPREHAAGARLGFGLTVIGQLDLLAFLSGLIEAGRHRWLGRGPRSAFVVERVYRLWPDETGLLQPGGLILAEGTPLALDWPPDPPQALMARVRALGTALQLRLRFLSPLCLRRSQRALDQFDGTALLEALRDRLGALAVAWDGWAPKEVPHGSVSWRDPSFHPVRLVRLGRGGEPQPISGILGEVTLAGELASLLPLLVAGERLQVGRHTAMGLGRYEICVG